MSDVFKKPDAPETAPNALIHADRGMHGHGMHDAARNGASNAANKREACQHVLEWMLSGSVEIREDASQPEGKALADSDKRPLLRLVIDDADMVSRYRQEIETQHQLGSTTTEKAVEDVARVLAHYYSMNDRGIRRAKAITGPIDIDRAVYGENILQTKELDAPEIHKWLGFGAGVSLINGDNGKEAIEILMHWPNIESLGRDYQRWQNDKQALAGAVQSGILEMADAAEYHGHGFAPLGYGRA